MTNPILSVIIPCYNQGRYLSETLSSFTDYERQQVYEVIIMDDGSDDEDTQLLLTRLANESSFRIIRQSNQGLCSARNNAIREARGKYILPVDSDDKISVAFIYKAIDVLDKQPVYDVVYSDGTYFGAKEGTWIIGEFNLQRLMLWNYHHVSAVFRRVAWERVGGYDTNLNHMGFEDWDLWLSIAFSGGRFYYIKEPLFSYRISAHSMTRGFTREKYEQLQKYIHKKHSVYLSKSHLSNHLALLMRQNRNLWLKLFLLTYFPKFLNKLANKGSIDRTTIF